MASPLLSIGTGLTGFMQGFQNARREAAQQALQRLYIEQQQRTQKANNLAGAGLLSGAIPGFGGGIGGGIDATSLPQPPSPGQPSIPNPPPAPNFAPQQPTAPAFNPAAMVQSEVDAAPMPMAAIPGRNTAIAPQAYDVDGQGPTYAGGNTGQMADQSPPIEREELPGPQPSAPEAIATSAPTPATDPAADQHPNVATTPEGSVIAHTSQGTTTIPQLFKTVDPQAIARAIAATPQGRNADPATIFEATAALLKMANGNKEAQMQAAMAGKLLGIQMQVAGRQQIAETNQAGAERRSERSDTTRREEGAANRGSREGIVDRQITSREGVAEANRTAAGERQTAQLDAASKRQIRGIEAAAERQGRALTAGEQRQIRGIEARAAEGLANRESREGIASRHEAGLAQRTQQRADAVARAASEKAAQNRGNQDLRRLALRAQTIRSQIYALTQNKQSGWFSGKELSSDDQKRMKELQGELAAIEKQLNIPTAPQ